MNRLMETMTNSHFRTMNYVEVILFERGHYKNRKFKYYPKEEARAIYQRSVNKAKEDKITALICLREENHILIKSVWLERNKF